MNVKFDKVFIVPASEQSKVNIQSLDLGEEGQNLFNEYRDLLGKGLDFDLSAGPEDGVPIMASFAWKGKTSGTVIWSTKPVGDSPKRLHGVSVLVGKLNAEDDKAAVEHAKQILHFVHFDQEQFDAVIPKRKMRSIQTFFPDAQSANFPALNEFTRMFGWAFFSRFTTPTTLN